MGRIKTQHEQDRFQFVLNNQMSIRGVLDDEEAEDRAQQNREIERRYINWFEHPETEVRRTLSYAIVRRRNSAYHSIVEQALGEEAIVLERYIYYCIENDIEPEVVVECKLKFSYDDGSIQKDVDLI